MLKLDVNRREFMKIAAGCRRRLGHATLSATLLCPPK